MDCRQKLIAYCTGNPLWAGSRAGFASMTGLSGRENPRIYKRQGQNRRCRTAPAAMLCEVEFRSLFLFSYRFILRKERTNFKELAGTMLGELVKIK